MNHNQEVLRRVRENFPDKYRARFLRLPGKQVYWIVDNDNVELHLSEKVVCSNMQEDASAFEGWAIVLKVWGGYKKVSLCWKYPKDTEDGHYQRFLFRVEQFQQQNKSWFSICDTCLVYLDALKIKTDRNYILNAPIAERNTEEVPHHKEARLEKDFSNPENLLYMQLYSISNAEFIERQLPVGVFEGEVLTKSAIFTRGKSAIDLWGINKNSELLIFELKAGGNNKVGIISELFFYTCVMQRVIEGQFKHLHKKDTNLALIPKTKKIKAYFLAYDLHPLIDPAISTALMIELNKMFPAKVEYHYIQIEKGEAIQLVY